MRKWLRKIILSEWLSSYAFEGLKPSLNLSKLSDKNLKEYSSQSKQLRDNLAYKDIRKLLVHRYESKRVKGGTQDEVYWSGAYLKILDEINLLVEHGVIAHDQRIAGKGHKKKYR